MFKHPCRPVALTLSVLTLLGSLSLAPISWSETNAQPGVLDTTAAPAAAEPSTLPQSLPTGPATPDALGTMLDNLSATPIHPTTVPFKTVIPTYVVFPIVTHTAFNKAFSDLPVLLATSVANKMQEKAQANNQTIQVLNPIYSFDTLKSKGLDRLYQKMVRDYVEGGRPLERDIYKLTDSLTTDTIRPTWVVFVEADFDTSRSVRPSGLEWLRYTVYDRYPRDPNMFITTRLKVFQLQDGMPLLSQSQHHTSIKYGRISYMTGSVFDNGAVYANFKDKVSSEAGFLITNISLGSVKSTTSTSATVVPSQQRTMPTTPTLGAP